LRSLAVMAPGYGGVKVSVIENQEGGVSAELE
jgi:hypothetical protein